MGFTPRFRLLLFAGLIVLYLGDWIYAAPKPRVSSGQRPLYSTGRSSKPGAPILLKISRSGAAEPGKTVYVNVTAQALDDIPYLRLRLLLPKGLVHREGRLAWNGPLRRNGVVRLRPGLALGGTDEAVVVAAATLRFADGSRISSVAQVSLSVPGFSKPGRTARIVRRAGARVIEHRGVER